MKSFGKYTASLPIDPHNSLVSKYFDAELREHNILFPEKDCINELYDTNIGLDRWTP